MLLSFADRRYRNALKRLERQTAAFPFTARHCYDETCCLTPAYWRRLKPWLYRRGYGYWEWKARLVSELMDTLSEGDIVVWADAGVYWNDTPEAQSRFRQYLAMLTPDCGILAFQQPYIEQEWTKGDLFVATGTYGDPAICTTPQLWGGCFMMRKCAATVALLREWNELNRRERELITDCRSTVTNLPGFKEHRHDQSAFSVLVKKQRHIAIPFAESHRTDGHTWDDLRSFPIQARREKELSRPLSEVIRNKLLRPWREALYVYFRHFRHYHFLGKGYPW